MNTETQIDAILGLPDSVVWVVTAADGDRRGGLLASWIQRVSLASDRPMVLAGLGPNHFTTELIDGSRYFGLHLLRPDQAELGLKFATASGRDHDKLAGLSPQITPAGVPLLTDCLARLECRAVDRLDTGDRIFFWGRVLNGHQESAEAPLRENALLAAADEAQRRILKADRQRDASLPWRPASSDGWN